MYPDQPQPQSHPTPPPPADYLNQIAPQTPKKLSFRPGPKLFIMIGLALVVAVIIVVIIVNVVVAQQRRPLQQLAARLTATKAVVEAAQNNIKSSQLRGLNSNLNIYLTNTNRDIATPFLSAGVDVAKPNEDVTKAVSTDAMSVRLENARLNARFDRVYALEMNAQLENIIIQMTQIINASSNAELKAFLESARTNLEPTQKAFAEFDAVNS